MFRSFILAVFAAAILFDQSDGFAQTPTIGAPPPAAAKAAANLTLPDRPGTVKFLAIGDTGTGSKEQKELANVISEYHKLFKFDFAIMMGDNMYGAEKPEDFKAKFEDVYKPLTDAGVKFYASLGNHDESKQRMYDKFNMNGKEYYRFARGDVAFYALNSNYFDKNQLVWLKSELAKDTSKWKIAFFHHPPYSSGGKHGSSVGLRETLEPIFVQNGVQVAFTGHEHFYERLKPQKGVNYFISGAGGKLRRGDVKQGSPITAKAYDADLSFMLIEVDNDTLHFQVISRTNETVDSGTISLQIKN